MTELTEIVDEGMTLPMVRMRSPFGVDTLTLEIRDKMFALFDLSKNWIFYNVKFDPNLSLLLRDRYSAIRPAFHMNKVHWNSIDIEAFPVEIHKAILIHAYMQTVKGMPKKSRIELFGDLDTFNEKYEESIKTLKTFLL